MSFDRIGSNEKIIGEANFNEKEANQVICPECKAIVAKEHNGIKKVGEVKLIGRIAIKCPNCKKEIEI